MSKPKIPKGYGIYHSYYPECEFCFERHGSLGCPVFIGIRKIGTTRMLSEEELKEIYE